MTNEIMEEVAVETTEPAVEPTDETNEIDGVALAASIVIAIMVLPFAGAFMAVTGKRKAEDFWSEKNVEKRKAKKEERKAKRLARKEEKAAKKLAKKQPNPDDEVNTDGMFEN